MVSAITLSPTPTPRAQKPNKTHTSECCWVSRAEALLILWPAASTELRGKPQMLRLVAQQTKLVPIFWARDDPEAAQWLRSGANTPPFASCLTSGSTRNPTHPVPNITKGKKCQRPVTITLPFRRDAQAHAWRGSRKPAMAMSESNAKIKGNVIHLRVLPRAEHSRKIFHKDLKILGSPCSWPKAA